MDSFEELHCEVKIVKEDFGSEAFDESGNGTELY